MTINATSGDENADSYVTVEEFTAYCEARGVAVPTSPANLVETWLRRGTSYLDNQYRERWKGYRATERQALAWPRVSTYNGSGTRIGNSLLVYGIVDADGFEIPTNEVPKQVKNAAIEAAFLIKDGVTLEPRLERGGQIKSISKGVGPLSKSITYMDGAPAVDRYTVVEGLLRGLVNSTPGSTSGNVNLVRA